MGKIMINDINFSGGGPQIDDTATSNSTTWSSNQTNTEITKVAHNSADEYDSTRTSSNKYNKGDLCIYQNTLYKCNADGGTYGPFDSSKWSSTTLSDELELKQNSTDSSLSTTSDTIVGAINELKDDITTPNYWKTTQLTIANGVSVNAGVETQPVTVSVPQYTGYRVLTFTEVRAIGYHGAKVTVQAELSNANELVYALYNPSNVNATVTVRVRMIYVKTIT